VKRTAQAGRFIESALQSQRGQEPAMIGIYLRLFLKCGGLGIVFIRCAWHKSMHHSFPSGFYVRPTHFHPYYWVLQPHGTHNPSAFKFDF
jgi:hypothetical protein